MSSSFVKSSKCRKCLPLAGGVTVLPVYVEVSTTFGCDWASTHTGRAERAVRLTCIRPWNLLHLCRQLDLPISVRVSMLQEVLGVIVCRAALVSLTACAGQTDVIGIYSEVVAHMHKTVVHARNRHVISSLKPQLAAPLGVVHG